MSHSNTSEVSVFLFTVVCVFFCRCVCNVALYMDCHFAQQPFPPMCNQIGSRSTVIFHRLMNRIINVNFN